MPASSNVTARSKPVASIPRSPTPIDLTVNRPHQITETDIAIIFFVFGAGLVALLS
jgi:hypothetical protein